MPALQFYKSCREGGGGGVGSAKDGDQKQLHDVMPVKAAASMN